MKFGVVIGGIVAAAMSFSTMAASLKVPPEVNLLVVNGKKVSSSLFRDTKGLDLLAGQHQILFRVVDTVKIGSNDEDLYRSVPIVVNFTVNDEDTINIKLPRVTTKAEAERFDRNVNFTLVTDTGKVIPNVHDTLDIQGLVIAADYELEMTKYNAGDNKASIKGLAQGILISPVVGQGSAAVVPVSNSNQMPEYKSVDRKSQKAVTLKGETAEEEMLQYWFQRADKDTQKRFIDWAKKQ